MASSGSKSIAATSNDTLKFSWWFNSNDQSVENNKTLVRWKLELIADAYGRISSSASKKWSVTVNGTNYNGTNTIGIGNGETRVLAGGTTTIAHNSDGTKTFSYSFSQEIAITWSGSYIGTVSGSGTGTLDTIPRKSTLSVGDGTLGTKQTLAVAKNADGFTHTIKYTCGSASGTICTKSGDTSTDFTPPLTLASQNTTGTTLSISYTIETFNGSTSLGTNKYTRTLTIPSGVVPTVSLTVADAMKYQEKFGAFIQGKSRFEITVTASGAYGSTISSCSTTANGKTYTDMEITTDVVSSGGELTIKTTVKDSRGRSAAVTKKVTVLAYTKPKISAMTVRRSDKSGNSTSSGTYLCVSFNAAVTSLNSLNSAEYKVAYKKKSDSSYTETELTDYKGKFSVSGGKYIFSADKGSSYDVILYATDALEEIRSTGTGSSIAVLWSVLKKGLGFAFGKIAERDNTLEVALKAEFQNDVRGPLVGLTTGTSALADGDDFDDYLVPGVYHSASSSYKFSNHPGGNTAGKLYVISSTGAEMSYFPNNSAWLYLVQIWMDLTGKNEYRRYIHTSGTAGEWTYTSWGKVAIGDYYPNTGGFVNGDVILPNGRRIYIQNTSGEYRTLVRLNSSNQAEFGNGGYANNEGASYFDGNSVNIRTKGDVLITGPNAGLTAREYGVNKTLWSGSYFMTAGHTVTLSQAVSNQPNGIVLRFSYYSSAEGAAQNYNFFHFFIPKATIVNHHSGGGHVFALPGTECGHYATKYLYIANTQITGHANNNSSGTGANGIKYNNALYVLRAVIGV